MQKEPIEILWRNRQNDRNQEPLTRHACLLQLGSEPLKEYPFVGGMLVHQNESLVVFHQYIEAAQHPQYPKAPALRLGNPRLHRATPPAVPRNRHTRG